MTILTVIIVFGASFAVVSALLFLSILQDGISRLRGAPRQKAITLGDDMRGRIATVTDISPQSGKALVMVGPETWKADLSSNEDVMVGQKVRITGVRGLTLSAKPVGRHAIAD